jgi:hypothetical protein
MDPSNRTLIDNITQGPQGFGLYRESRAKAKGQRGSTGLVKRVITTQRTVRRTEHATSVKKRGILRSFVL